MNARTADSATSSAIHLLLVAILLLAAPVAALAADPVGRILSSTGRVTAVDANGFQRTLTRNDVVFAGDEVKTGRRGRVQIRFRDEGLIDLKPDTQFEIEEFRTRRSGGGGSAVFNFLKGALRTISGLIGSEEEDEYQMNTPVATVGIRGTEYSLQFCDSACAEQGLDLGLYGRVTSETVIVTNEFGAGEFGAGQYFFTPPDGPPELLLTPPEGVLDGKEDGNTGQQEEDEGEELAETEQEGDQEALGEPEETGTIDTSGGDQEFVTSSDEDFESGETGVEDNTTEDVTTTGGGTSTSTQWLAAGTSGAIFGGSSFLGFSTLVGPPFEGVISSTNATLTSQQFVLDANGNLQSFRFEFDDGSSTEADFTGMTLQQSGSKFGVDWGLLTGSWDFTVDDGAGFTETINTDSGGVAFSVTDAFTSPTQLAALTGSLSYSIDAGPDAVDGFGNIWLVDTLAIDVDFTNVEAFLTGFQVSDPNTTTITTTGAQALVLDTSLGALFVDPESPVTGSWTASGGSSGTADVQLAGFFIGNDGSVLNVSFSVDQLDSDGITLINSITGLKLLQGQ